MKRLESVAVLTLGTLTLVACVTQGPRTSPSTSQERAKQIESEFGALYRLSPDVESFAVSPENPLGAKGRGAPASSRKQHANLPKIAAGETVDLARLTGQGIFTHFWFTVPVEQQDDEALRSLVIRMYWDGESTPSIQCPVGDFFGLALGAHVPFESELTGYVEGKGLNAYFPMPFQNGAHITLTNEGTVELGAVFYQLDFVRPRRALSPDSGRLHVDFHRDPATTLRHDFVILQATGEGRFLGVVLGMHALDGDWWGEGEVKMYIDGDREAPTINGTGTEDYFGSAWGLGVFSHRYSGAPVVRPPRFSLYRWHVADPIYFHHDLRVTIQQIGGHDVGGSFRLYDRRDDVTAAAFWYQSEPHAVMATWDRAWLKPQ